jgi:hypothetical protein
LEFKRLPGYSADDFFEIISKRHENGSLIITIDKTFEQWGDIFTDNILASAMLDRVVYYSSIIKINGPNFQSKRKEEIGFNFFVLQLWKKSGFYSGILLGFAVQKKKRKVLLLPSKNLIYFIFYQEE